MTVTSPWVWAGATSSVPALLGEAQQVGAGGDCGDEVFAGLGGVGLEVGFVHCFYVSNLALPHVERAQAAINLGVFKQPPVAAHQTGALTGGEWSGRNAGRSG
jgi:hypothetical protein